jgi:hypothetical protein
MRGLAVGRLLKVELTLAFRSPELGEALLSRLQVDEKSKSTR